MTLEIIKNIFKDVMYLDENENVDVNKSLFLDYDMTSIDFIDFAFEVKKTFSLSAEPEDFWPIGKMATLAEYYDASSRTWSEEGINQLKVVLACSGHSIALDPTTGVRPLYEYFTLKFVSQKVKELQHSEVAE